GVPVFLMGHSMGGGIVLSFATRTSTADAVAKLAGVIGSSPMLRLTHPPSSFTRWSAGKASAVLPNVLITTPVDGRALSHDQSVGEAFKKDPLVQPRASLQTMDAMFSKGEQLLKDPSKWPQNLPLLIVHGGADNVCSPEGSKEFFEKLEAKDKHLSIFPGGFHELHNEPDGISEKFVDECVSWAEARLSANSTSETGATSSKL
ncbi:alpha beta-hydrolase, partial [Amylostereum chailletii]